MNQVAQEDFSVLLDNDSADRDIGLSDVVGISLTKLPDLNNEQVEKLLRARETSNDVAHCF